MTAHVRTSMTRHRATLLRFHLRRDRMMLFWWIAGDVLLYYSQAVSTDGLYATQAELDKAAAGMEGNAAFIAMAGPGPCAQHARRSGRVAGCRLRRDRRSADEHVPGRPAHPRRGGERARRARAGRGDRPARPAGGDRAARRHRQRSAWRVLVAGSLIGYGLPVAGSVALGLAAGLTGWCSAAVALVAAQLVESTRAAYGITGAVIGVAYALRAVGDVGNGALSWLSPIGWGQYLRPYADEQWWPALLSIVAIVVLGFVAVMLFDRRDIGSGVWPARPGPARGSLGSASGAGLAAATRQRDRLDARHAVRRRRVRLDRRRRGGPDR